MSVYKLNHLRLIDDILDNSDPTKKLKISLNNISSNTTRTLSVPDTNTTIVGTDANQILTNKTIVGNTNVVDANSLKTNSTAVVVSNADPPTIGQVLMATSATTANWQNMPEVFFGGIGIPEQPELSTVKQWFGKSGSISGIASFNVTMDGTTTGIPIFTDIENAFMIATGKRDSNGNTDVPFCSIKNIINEGRTIEVNVRLGNSGQIKSGGQYVGMKNADDGTVATLLVVGV